MTLVVMEDEFELDKNGIRETCYEASMSPDQN